MFEFSIRRTSRRGVKLAYRFLGAASVVALSLSSAGCSGAPSEPAAAPPDPAGELSMPVAPPAAPPTTFASTVPGPPPPVPPDAKLVQFKTKLQSISARVNTQGKEIKIIKSSGFVGVNCRGAEVFDVDDVKRAVAIIRNQLLDAATSSELPALHDYIEGKITTMPSGGGSSNQCFPGRAVLTRDEAKTVFSPIISLIQKLERASTLSVSFSVTSTPSPARVEIIIHSTQKHVLDKPANLTASNIYRGKYELVVTKQGYQPFRGELNLVDSDTPTVDCNLRPEGETDESSCNY